MNMTNDEQTRLDLIRAIRVILWNTANRTTTEQIERIRAELNTYDMEQSP